jgi:GNAT superfamily N-acetyltransferase
MDMISSTYMYDSNQSLSINIPCDEFHVASAEISKIPNENCWYFNRLIVPQKFRNKGFATQLLKALEVVADNKKINIACDINPYGDLDFNQLHTLYAKFGFIDSTKYHMMRYCK